MMDRRTEARSQVRLVGPVRGSGSLGSTFNLDRLNCASEIETLRWKRRKIKEDTEFRKWRQSAEES